MRDNSPSFEPQIDSPQHSGECELCGDDCGGDYCPTCRAALRHQEFWYAEAQDHRRTCRECSIPIIDDEGNPGPLGEACAAGSRILQRYMHYDEILLNQAILWSK